jgi:hypothetical protein
VVLIPATITVASSALVNFSSYDVTRLRHFLVPDVPGRNPPPTSPNASIAKKPVASLRECDAMSFLDHLALTRLADARRR